jgi:predicted cupin superfamily sugar epimerase
MTLNFAVLTATILPGFIIARGVPSGKIWQSNLNRGDWHYKTCSLQCYLTPFHSFKDLEIINEVSFIQFQL